MAKRPRTPAVTDGELTDIQPVRTPQVTAGPCPKSDLHTATRVYKTEGKTRRCVCDDCGATWKQTGPPADPLKRYALEIAAALDAAERSDDGGDQVICLTDLVARTISQQLRRLAD